jgi:hypothetical protein
MCGYFFRWLILNMFNSNRGLKIWQLRTDPAQEICLHKQTIKGAQYGPFRNGQSVALTRMSQKQWMARAGRRFLVPRTMKLHTHFCEWTKAKANMDCLTDFLHGLGSYGRNQYLAVQETVFCYTSSVIVNSKIRDWNPFELVCSLFYRTCLQTVSLRTILIWSSHPNRGLRYEHLVR